MQVAASIAARPEPALPAGFAEFYAEHYDFVWRCALRMGVAADDVDDIVQECFVVALRRFDRFDPAGQARPTTWLFAILRNVQRNHARSARRRAARLELLANEGEAVSRGDADSSLARRLLDEFLATLGPDKRAAFVLADIEGMTGPELAHALELNLNTANARVRAARQAFRRHFDEPSVRTLARAELGRSASDRAPEQARRAGLPAVVALAGLELPGKAAVGTVGIKWLAGLLFGAACLGGAGILASGGSVDSAVVPAAEASSEPRTATVEAPAPVIMPEPAAAPEPAISVEATPAPSFAPRRTRAQPRALERLEQAREALLADEPERALELVEGRRFSAALEGRRIATEVAALCRLDRPSLAQARARAWRDEHPDDPTATQLHGVCWSE